MALKWQNTYTADRFGLQPGSASTRSAFERDYDRIVFSSAFRRLQNKTQVFPLPQHIFVHNRLTHSLEAASVGRSLGQLVGEGLCEMPGLDLPEEARDFFRNQLKNVIAAACLAHDLGNPAFGHSGEEAISKFFIDNQSALESGFSPAQWLDLTNFEGNANALRVLTRQFKGRLEGGYRLTYTTLGSILKYPCESTARDKSRGKHRSKYGFFQSDKTTFLDIADRLQLVEDQQNPLAYLRHPFVYLVEAADDICYSIIDYEDAHRLGILSFEEVQHDLLQLLRCHAAEDISRVEENLRALRQDKNESVAYLRAKCISFLVNKSAEVFLQQQAEILKGSYNSSLIEGIAEIRDVWAAIAKKSLERIYRHESVLKIELAGFRIMSGLVEDLVEAAMATGAHKQKRHRKLLSLMPLQYQFGEEETPYEKMMCLLDFVSGMTDNYALELYRNLRGISVPEI